MNKQADDIRDFCLKKYINKAREKNKKIVEIRAGDIDVQMNLNGRCPNVCSALQSKKFLKLANVSILKIEGPNPGANCLITFSI